MASSRLKRALLLIFLGASGVCLAQLDWGWGGRSGERSGTLVRIEGGEWVDEATVRTARETASHSTGTPTWENPAEFKEDVFTFARVLFRSERRASGRPRWLGWYVDYPDADLNLSLRLQQLTSMKVDPDARVIRLTDPDLPDYPFLYMVHPEGMVLDDAEVTALAGYLRAGGSLVVGDFWGTQAWQSLEREVRRVFPARSWVDLPMTHPIFNCLFQLRGAKQDMQIPTLQFWNRNFDANAAGSHVSRPRGEGYEELHIRAILDDRERIMVIAFHNCDLSDGWEREGENEEYFRRFSEKRAYPLAMNLVFYLMTH